MGDYKGWTGLSPPAAYPDRLWRRYANNGNLWPRHYVHAIDYYSSPDSAHDSSHQTRAPVMRTDNDPASK